jgi:hypothetical protein
MLRLPESEVTRMPLDTSSINSSLHSRWLELGLTAFFGALAFGTWATHGYDAAITENPLSARALFVWLAVSMAGLVVGVLLGMFSAPGWSQRRWADRPSAPGDMNDASLMLGLFLLGIGMSPVYDPSTGPGDWLWLVVSAFVGAASVALHLMVRGERRRFQAHAAWPRRVPYPPA